MPFNLLQDDMKWTIGEVHSMCEPTEMEVQRTVTQQDYDYEHMCLDPVLVKAAVCGHGQCLVAPCGSQHRDDGHHGLEHQALVPLQQHATVGVHRVPGSGCDGEGGPNDAHVGRPVPEMLAGYGPRK